MEEEKFKRLCPNLYNAIQKDMHIEELYGVKFRTHSCLTRRSIIEKAEDYRAKVWFKFNSLPETHFLMVLN